MGIHQKVKQYELSPEELEKGLQEAMGETGLDEISSLYDESIRSFKADSIVKGKVLRIVGGDVIIDVGYKSEGIIPLEQFDRRDEIKDGQIVEVLLEAVEDEAGLIVLSKRKADRIRNWERVIATYKEGDVVTGRVTRKIKGGLLVEIGVPVFLPASQVDIRRVGDVAEYIGQEVEAKIIKIDEGRMNIVVSRRKLLEERREEQKKKLLSELREGDIIQGRVKNLADFGAFVDLGGIDGLLHITDMSWGRVGHPSEVVNIEQDIEIKVLKIDLERERISLGLKQRTPSPWQGVEERYPLGSRVSGKVVNVLSYGAFVQLEEGIEGLVHVSEMSWTRRINHPSEVVNINDEVEVVVLDINPQKQEISLGMKQTEANPWDMVEEKYPVGTKIAGKVRNLTNYGAFVEIEEGIDGLLHVSDMSWTRKVLHPSEIVKKGEDIEAVVLAVDQEKKRVALGIKQLVDDPWQTRIPQLFAPGTVVPGKVTKVTNFGVFVRLESDLEGLLHISELSDRKVENPSDFVDVGQDLVVKVIKIDETDRKIGLSLRKVTDAERETVVIPEEPTPEPEPEPEVAEAPVEETAETPAEEPPPPPAKTEETAGETEETADKTEETAGETPTGEATPSSE